MLRCFLVCFSFGPTKISNGGFKFQALWCEDGRTVNIHTWVCIQTQTHLFYQQFLAHGDALVEPLLVLLQEFLLLVDLSPQVTVSLLKRESRECVKLWLCTKKYNVTKSCHYDTPLLIIQHTGHRHWTHPEQVVYSPLFLFQVQTLVALQSSEF